MNPTHRRRREQDGLVVTTRGNRRLIMVNAASCSAGARKSRSPPQTTGLACRVTTRGNGAGLNPLISPGANRAKSVENDPSGTCALPSPNMSPNGVGHVTVRCGLAAE